MSNKYKSIDKAFEECNDFENICKNNVKDSNRHEPLQDFLKVTYNGQSDVYNGKGDRLSYKDKQEMYNEMCMRT